MFWFSFFSTPAHEQCSDEAFFDSTSFRVIYHYDSSSETAFTQPTPSGAARLHFSTDGSVAFQDQNGLLLEQLPDSGGKPGRYVSFQHDGNL